MYTIRNRGAVLLAALGLALGLALAAAPAAALPLATAGALPPATPEHAATPEQAATAEQAAAAQQPPAETAAPNAAPAAQPRAGTVQDAVSPIGTTIDLFDYWITTRTAPDNVNPADMDQGINAGHALQFTASPGRGPGINNYTGSSAPRTGMVERTLQNGYPQLTQSGQSLAYLFDPAQPNAGKLAFANVRDLLQIDADNYFYYNCRQNFAQFDESANAFTLYDSPGVYPGGASGLLGQFFPFNRYDQVRGMYATNAAINHYFGVTMTTRFVQQPYGTVEGEPGGTPVTYEFSGDDDVWVFIDGVLVGDLGGIHDAASLAIDFSTGAVTVNGQPDGTLQDKFTAAGRPWAGNGATFADDTYHTLKFFYLERGNYDSNMQLKFNLVSIPQSDLIKVDQTGDAVPGAQFALYYANDDYTYDAQNLLANGTTGPDGTFVFQNPDGTLLSLNNLKDAYGGPGRTGKFVLVETSTPAGYRTPGPVELYFPPDFPELATLLSGNPWETGAYASPTVTVTLPDRVQDLQGNTYDVDDGLYFAVVLKRQDAGGDGSAAQSDWYPVSGEAIAGWQVAGSTGPDAVLQAARADRYVFTLDSSGAYKSELDNLPGDILTYYYVLLANGRLTADNAQYTLGFYRTGAPSLDAATPQNTVRLATAAPGGGSFEREFAVRLYVPNVKNYLFVQKVSEDGAPLEGAAFALYRAADVTDGAVDPGAQPFDTVTTRDLSQAAGDVVTLPGGGAFPAGQPALPAGTYYLKELQPPAGYAPSDELTEVIVDNTGAYADAGTAGDDVTVLLSVGKIVRSMLQFAVPDNVNTTLSDVYAALYTAARYPAGAGADWPGWNAAGGAPLALSYSGSDEVLEYGPTTPGGPVYFAVQAGWAQLRVTQDYAGGQGPAYKTDLGSQDLTALFARSTVVRVRDQSTRLVVQKAVTGPCGEAAREFAFTLTLRDAQGAPLAGDFGGLTFAADGTARAALADGGEVTLRGLPAGAVCTIEEEAVPGYETTVRVDGGDAQPGPAVTVTPPPGLTAVVFTNHSDCPPASPTPSPSAPPEPTPSASDAPEPSSAPASGAAPAPSPTAGAADGAPAGQPPAESPGDTLPPTGDAAQPTLWGAAALAALAALLWLVRRRA